MKIDQHTDPMAYQPDMEITSSAIMEQVLAARAAHGDDQGGLPLLHVLGQQEGEELFQMPHKLRGLPVAKEEGQHHFWNSWHKGHRQKHVNISVMPSICSPRFISPTTAKITASTAALTATTISNAPSLLPLK